jgi:SAM-dependent methyltransferase
MLALDRQVARERGLELKLVEGSMDDLSGLPEQGFDAVFQPVSTCYVADILAVYREVARVLAGNGLYLSQHKQPAALQAAAGWSAAGGYLVSEPSTRSARLPDAPPDSLHREAGTVEHLHRWEDLAGGLCRAGFVIEDVVEPRRGDSRAAPGSFEHRSLYLPPFVAFKARRAGAGEAAKARLWTPS